MLCKEEVEKQIIGAHKNPELRRPASLIKAKRLVLWKKLFIIGSKAVQALNVRKSVPKTLLALAFVKFDLVKSGFLALADFLDLAEFFNFLAFDRILPFAYQKGLTM